MLWFKYKFSKEIRCSCVVKSVSDKQPRNAKSSFCTEPQQPSFPFVCARSLHGILGNSIQASGSPSGWPWPAAPPGTAKAVGCIPSGRHRMGSSSIPGGSGRNPLPLAEELLLLWPLWSGWTFPAVVLAPVNVRWLKPEMLWQNFTHS